MVVDASAIVALLTAEARVGDWVAHLCHGATLAAPELMMFEVANVLRRHELAGLLDATSARLAHQDLLDLAVQRWPYPALADRAWKLRATLTVYDAAYAALAELLDAPLVTLDARISRAIGPRCNILTYTSPD